MQSQNEMANGIQKKITDRACNKISTRNRKFKSKNTHYLLFTKIVINFS